MINLKEFKQSVLQKAMQGKLTEQLPSDGNAKDLLNKIADKKKRLYQAGKLKKSDIKPLAPVTDKDKPFKIPKNWEWTRLNTITDINLGKTPPKKNKSYWSNGTIPWVSVSDLNNGLIKDTKNKVTKKSSIDIFKSKIVPAGSLLMSFKLSIGKMGILGVPAYHNEAIASFRLYIDKRILKEFLYYFLPTFTKFVPTTSAVKGKTLNKSKLKKMLIPLPTLVEQKRIVAKVHKCFELADTIQKERKLNKKFAHDMKQSLLMEAMQGKLTKQLPSDGNARDLLVKIANYKRNLVQSSKLKGYSKPLPSIKKNEELFSIPDNWQWTRLSTITPITLGKTPARHNTSYWNGNIPWVSIADLNNGIVSDTKEDITSKAANKIFHNDITPAGSLLMSFKLTIGKMGILKYPAYHNEAIVSFKFFVHKANKIILRNYLYYTLPLLTAFVRSTSAIKGNTLNKSKLKRMLIPLPPLAEQKRIVNVIQRCFLLI